MKFSLKSSFLAALAAVPNNGAVAQVSGSSGHFEVNDEPLASNFVISSTPDSDCWETCGAFGDAFLGTNFAVLGTAPFPTAIGDLNDSDNDYYVNGFDAEEPVFIHLTSTNTEPFCPSTVKFDFDWVVDPLVGSYTKARTLSLQVLDDGGNVVLEQLAITTGLPDEVETDSGTKTINLVDDGFTDCIDGGKLSFAWEIPEASTGPGQFIMDNVYVNPIGSVGMKEF